MRGVVGLGLMTLFLAGCGGPSRQVASDPLVGGQPPLPPTEATARAKDQPLPPVPAPSASTSPANLASGGVPTLDGGRDLRIGDNQRDAGGWRGETTGVSLTKPVPPAPAAPGPLPPVPVAQMGGLTPAVAASSTDLLRVLEQRGVQGFRLERNRETGEWRCTCSIPSRANPAIKQVYNAAAADAPTALQSVIDQIDRESR